MIPSNELPERLEAKPFAPFRLFPSDGRTFDIRDANQVWTGRGRQTAAPGFPAATDPRLIDRHATVSLLQVVSIKPLELAASN